MCRSFGLLKLNRTICWLWRSVLNALAQRFERPDGAKLALDQRFGRPEGAKLALDRRCGRPDGVKLALDRRLGRPGGAKLALERRLERPWTPREPWNGVLGALAAGATRNAPSDLTEIMYRYCHSSH